MTTNSKILREKIIQGLELTYQRLLKEKADRNLELVVLEDGKVVFVDPREYGK